MKFLLTRREFKKRRKRLCTSWRIWVGAAGREVSKEDKIPKEAIIVPPEIKPFLEKEITFELFQ